MHPEDALKTLGSYLLYIIVGLLVLTFMPAFAHGSVSHKHQNSLGAVIDDLNPNVYLVAMPVQEQVFDCSKTEICTNVLFRPYGTDLMHTESITFCGNESENILNGVQAVIYQRISTRYYEGIGCHDLEKVFPLTQEVGQ